MAARAVVFPGDEVAIAEEFLAGPGTYEENGTVYAARLGLLDLDPTEFTASVHPVTTTPVTLRVGDVVIGTIEGIRSSMAIVEVVRRVDAPGRPIAGDTNGTLHISKAADYYLENMEDAYRMKDVVRAEVTQVEPSVQLTTRAPQYGALKSYCPRDRVPMEARGKGLVCPECEWKMPGKLAADYGEGHLAFVGEIPEPSPERRGPPRGGGRGGRDRDRRGGRGRGRS